MSQEGGPTRNPVENKKGEGSDVEASQQDVLTSQEIEKHILQEAGSEREYWSPDYYEIIGDSGNPLLDAQGKHIIVEVGVMTIGGQSSPVVKVPNPEPVGRGARRKNIRESSTIKPLSAFSSLVSDQTMIGVRRVRGMHIETSIPAAVGNTSQKRVERVDARDIGKAQSKIIAALLDKGFSTKTVANVLASGNFGPRMKREELVESIRSAKGVGDFIAIHSYLDVPGFVIRAAVDAAGKIQSEDARSTRRSMRESRAEMYMRSEQYLRDLLGEMDDERWRDAKEAISKLRGEIDTLQWFSFGSNSADIEQRGRYTQLTLAPQDAAQEKRLTDLFSRLTIQPWPELEGNVSTLVIEYRRDIEILRSAMIFDYLLVTEDRKFSQILAEEAEEKMAKVQEWLKSKQREVDEFKRRLTDLERDKQEEQEQLMKIDLETKEFRGKRKAEKERLVAEFFAAIPEPTEGELVRPTRIPVDHYYRFGYPNIPQTSPRGLRSELPKEEPREEDSQDADYEIEQMQEAFDRGQINEESLEKETGVTSEPVRGAQSPTLVLFPRKYVWMQPNPAKKGFLRERTTGRVLTEQDVLNEVLEARTGSPEHYENSIRELILMNRTLILWKLRQVKQRHPHVDSDDLFQAGINGMAYAVDHYEMRPDTRFNSFLIPCMEGFMRRVAEPARFRAVRVPSGVAARRKKIIDAERALQSAQPDQKVEPRDIARLLYERGVLKDDSMRLFDKYLRKTLYAYQETDVELLEDETFSPDDVDMLGRALQADSVSSSAEMSELREKMNTVLQTLTPREERVIREYFELYLGQEKTASNVYEGLREQLAGEGIVLSSEEVKLKAHELTGYGNLNEEETLAKLFGRDRTFALRYIELLNKHTSDETFESVAQRRGITRERVRQIMAKAIRKIKHPIRSRYLRTFVEN